MAPELVFAATTHARRGAVRHAFRYRVDYVLIDPEERAGPALFSRTRPALASVRDRDHGGPRGAGRGAPWAREVLAARGLPLEGGDRLLLLTQPRIFGRGFNPVSFWLATRGEALLAVIAEVNNTFGDRHSYLCAKPCFAPILPSDRLEAEKVFHVSPFQEVGGSYSFGFDIREDRLSILIAHRRGAETLHATLAGRRQPMTNAGLIAIAARLPFGGLRTSLLIHWQALRLKLKGAPYRARPLPPEEEVT
ncbi:DUF1365 domain-containing protein [Pseudoroseicyclus tamaricis]|uniref:DUF1365 domain-containing protein n=1 Tax=Pseudoroseicyclus tamaricis TaxID=2705421 RepID=A0A6B2K168_9RHOB|nr:DUF1365 domain-containing protein [Pseudoroseicyclus tamaricis]NDV01442.1 DUF1365 domain-containing protein [Pseudoroseicyclus tamaricis]